jgi:hypothetical protein
MLTAAPPRFKVSVGSGLVGLEFDTDCRQLDPVHSASFSAGSR